MSEDAKVVPIRPGVRKAAGRPARHRRTPGPEEEALRQRLAELERTLAAARSTRACS
jgi:hypothetical protein